MEHKEKVGGKIQQEGNIYLKHKNTEKPRRMTDPVDETTIWHGVGDMLGSADGRQVS